MKKKLCSILLVASIALALPSGKAFANGVNAYDGTPITKENQARSLKACSVDLVIEGIEGEPYYVTMLSKEPQSGFYYADDEYTEDCGSKEIWDKFSSYSDVDGYYSLQKYAECSKDNVFTWYAYPPEDFKVLIYLPNEDRFLCSTGAYKLASGLNMFKVVVTDNQCISEVVKTF